ncbi:LacI family DNA-binding transcriptional regulator [Pedobacter panaciterrae]|uniref:LacI family DNA-binding transcriptional regulator n=1 Tax=Pedobacter panaciterrae TaxID=363849 RepID=UPI00155DD1B3|nr:LacI family DNA-binding transcriptional regulator [Pedobacter panaciterrae]NQX53231.1 LacI family DNA-binding transcriptional regulator [Pedobacter panaciterrae]
MYKPITLKDIAIALDLSPSTVSRALRDTYDISEKTKKLVNDYATLVNYQSNPMAAGLRSKKSKSIGIVVPDLANSFFSQAISGIESIAEKEGYHTIISQTKDSYHKEIEVINHMANRYVDGLIITMSSETTEYTHLQQMHKSGLPIVFFDRIVDEINTYKVVCNNFESCYKATTQLIENGKRNIAFLANAPQLSISKERIGGYKTAMTDQLISSRDELIKFCPSGGSDYEEVELAIKQLMALDESPDAIFVAGDRLSMACLRAVKNLGIKSDELSIIGFSNVDIIDLLQTPISHIRQRAFEMGQISMTMLLKIIEAKYPINDFDTKVIDADIFWVEHLSV